MHKKHGLFISLEGGEGSGKSTQIRLMKEYLESLGHHVVITREPGGTKDAEKIRDLLVQREGGNWSPVAECFLLFAARQMHYNDLIKPALQAGSIVISDRFTDSTRAYQGYGMGLDQETIEDIKQHAIGDVEPDLTLILDIPAEQGLARSNHRLETETKTEKEGAEDRYELLGQSFHETLRQGYLKIAQSHPDRCRVLDARDNIESLQQSIRNEIDAVFTRVEGLAS